MNLLIDIDGTICDDISNKEYYKFATANIIDNSVEYINNLYNQGHNITFFTARLEKHRTVTEEWLKINNFKYHKLIMDKPTGGNYIWIDNLYVKGINYKNSWKDVILQLDKHFKCSKI